MDSYDDHDSIFDSKRAPNKLNAKYIGVVYSLFAGFGILGALLIALSLGHTHPNEKSNLFGYKDEWFLPVSLVTNFSYHERSFFQIFNAMALGPKFTLVILWYLLMKTCNSHLSTITLSVGLLKTITQALFIYIPPEDDHEIHDMAKFTNMLLTVSWIVSILYFKNRRNYLSEAVNSLIAKRIAYTMAILLIPLTHYFTQHRIYQVPGTYSLYSLFDWILLFLELAFDYITSQDLQALEIRLIPTKSHQARKPSKVIFNV